MGCYSCLEIYFHRNMVKLKVKVLVTQSRPTLRPHGAHQAPLSMENSRQEYRSG